MWLINTIHTYNGILAVKKNEILPFVTTWMDLESLMPSEISQKKTKYCTIYLNVGSKEQNKWTNIQRNRVTNTETGAKVEVGRVRREKGEGEQVV